MAGDANRAIIDLRKVCKVFSKPSGEPLPVLADIDMAMRDGEILGLLGRSGSGKSTLLRIAGGLIKPTSGQVIYRASQLVGPAEGIAVVFQTFALFPWLTVLENVEAGLDAIGLPRKEMQRRAQSAIDLIGLDGLARVGNRRSLSDRRGTSHPGICRTEGRSPEADCGRPRFRP
jgi:NitT/TauT family transport system ATP-binding protein